MAKARSTSSSSKLKKRWYPIIAPKMFNEQIIGEILIADPSKAIGKTVPANLMNLTGDMKKQSTDIIFSINSVTGEKASTGIIGYKVSSSHIKRLVRRGKNKVDVSFIINTADNKRARIKIVLVTIGMTYLPVLGSLRKAAQDFVSKAAAKMKFEDIVREVITNKLQIELRKHASKIYPIRICEVRRINIEKEKRLGAVEEAPVEKPEEKEEKKEEKPKKQRKKKAAKKETAEKKEEPKEEAPKAEEKPKPEAKPAPKEAPKEE